jgi:protein TonB
MENKKNPKLNLEQHRFIFFQIGLVLSLAFVIAVMNWTTTTSHDLVDKIEGEEYVQEQIDISATYRSEKKRIKLVKNNQVEPKPVPAPVPVPSPSPVIPIPEGEPFIEPGGDPWGEPLEPEIPVSILLCEKGPVFPGCEGIVDKKELQSCFNEKIMELVAKEVKYPREAREMGVQGKVYVNFIIEKDGHISNIQIVRSVDQYLDAEARRVIKTIPRMKPATQRGKPARMTMTMPINFVLQ